jgi:hypothetical protein
MIYPPIPDVAASYEGDTYRPQFLIAHAVTIADRQNSGVHQVADANNLSLRHSPVP